MVMIVLIGMPMLLMEFCFGQYFGVGSLSIFKFACPLFHGTILLRVSYNFRDVSQS